MKKIVMSLMVVLFSTSVCWGVEPAPRITDREIVERLTKLEAGQKAILREIDNPFDSINRRLDQLTTILIAVISAFAGIVAVTIGFAIWDRRTMIQPFESKVRGVELELEQLAGQVKSIDADKVKGLIGAMRKLAARNTEVADALKNFNLL